MALCLLNLVIVGDWIVEAHAKDNILVHGWKPEPDGRGTWSIVWTCLVTIFLCTWSVQHDNVPPRHGRWYLLLRKLKWMTYTVIAPEIILAEAVQEFFVARDRIRYLGKCRGYESWTLTHIMFMRMGGFYCLDTTGNEVDFTFKQLQKHLADGVVVQAPISREELADRGESDWIIKIVRICQVTWFLLQTLFRAIQHFHTTALEISTVAFLICSIFTYGFYWSAPQNVQYQVLLGIPDHPDNPTQYVSVQAEESRDTEVVLTSSIRPFEVYRPGPMVRIDHELMIPLTIGAGFGALHCLAWDAPYPTLAEKITWRVCSITTTVAPLPVIAVELMYHRRMIQNIFDNIISYVLLVLYISARLALITLAFTSLRTLPADAYETVSWSNYFPHFAA